MLSNRQQKELQLIEAAARGELKTVKVLIEKDAVNVNCAVEVAPFLEEKKENKVIAFISNPKKKSNAKFSLLTSPTYKTPLSESIIHGRNAVFDYLIARGAD